MADNERVIEVVTVHAPIDKRSKPAEGALKTPHDWALAKGFYVEVSEHIPQVRSHAKLPHAVADTLHGWTQYEHHFADKPFLLSEADYDAAVDAGLNYPNKDAHPAALPPKA